MISEILLFLTGLNENNNKDWFTKNKIRYDKLRKDFEAFIQSLISKIMVFDDSIGEEEASKSVFRIYRDVRFSKDKRPYKNNFGAYIAKSGKKGKNAGYYIHIQPGESFIACGVYKPDNEVLKEIRNEIYNSPDSFTSIIENKEFKNVFGEIWGDKLKKAPKDFPADFSHIELLKYKDYIAMKQFTDNDLSVKDLDDIIVKVFHFALPFNNYFNRIINELG